MRKRPEMKLARALSLRRLLFALIPKSKEQNGTSLSINCKKGYTGPRRKRNEGSREGGRWEREVEEEKIGDGPVVLVLRQRQTRPMGHAGLFAHSPFKVTPRSLIGSIPFTRDEMMTQLSTNQNSPKCSIRR